MVPVPTSVSSGLVSSACALAGAAAIAPIASLERGILEKIEGDRTGSIDDAFGRWRK